MSVKPVLVAVPAAGRDSGFRKDPEPSASVGLLAKFARWRCRFTASPVPSARRREATIHAYVGKNGSGKTACAVRDSLTTLDGILWECSQPDHKHCDPQYEGTGEDRRFVGYGPDAVFTGHRRVLSTVRLIDSETGEDHALYDRFWNWSQFEEAEHCDVVMDEMTGVAHSRGSGLPPEIMLILNQLRKREVILRWTAPAWARADLLIRECTNAVTACVGSYPARGSGGLWLPNRRFLYRTYDTADFDDFTAGKRERLAPDIKEWVWGPGSRAFSSYDTREAVTRLGQTSDAGICVGCGGSRRRQECSCADYQARKPVRAARRDVVMGPG